ncbi:hypothetical protein [Streptomyces sp. CB01881]|uniref:hypothetical protein n=1 Tax=Streptomyces sp. CB01881 TaxID=2078691 RepID=UPI000CDCABA1|nr:hypothetical protein [Streptomyces sp. CB01881]AUY53764.1 hypothetical protein C2142_38630 [Streptomyces sp. CB01881]TYC68774.1 hypothetical protein EH183_38625 [Streptomyces sp. CB01881]
MTSAQPPPRAISALIPDARAKATPGEKAAAQLAHLRSATVPVPILAAAAELIAPQLEDPDQATREAVGTVHAPSGGAGPRWRPDGLTVRRPGCRTDGQAADILLRPARADPAPWCRVRMPS